MCEETPHTCRPTKPGLTRRTFIASAAAGSAAALAGCMDGTSEDETAPEPITLTEEHTCDVCHMVIPMHPGPTAQIFYRDQQPEGHDNPARFCSCWEAFSYYFEHEQMGWEAEIFYVTDYSSVDYSISEESGAVYISSHPEAEAHANVEELYYVIGSDANGAMGSDLLPFSIEDDAAAFASERGGEVVTNDDVTPELIGQLATS